MLKTMNILIKYTKLTLLFSLMVFLLGCENEEQLPKITAGFTFTLNEDTGTVTFINTSTTNATKFVWDFGDEETSTEINPIKTYPSGFYIVSLTASNSAGASNVFKDTIVVDIKLPILLPITFDNSDVNYEATTFNGASFAIVDNPSQSGTNNKPGKVGAITNTGNAYEGLFFDLGSPIDLATDKTISINFRSTASVSILLKLEEGTSGPIETTVTHGGTGWEKLSFNFTSSAKYSRVTLFVDGPGTTAGTFYIDDIEQKQTEVLCVAETTENINPASGDINWTFKTNDAAHTFEAFGNTSGAIVTNPVINGINSSCKVQKFTKTAGCETWSGLGTTLATALDFGVITKKAFKMKVLAETQVTQVTLRLERLPFPDTEPSQDRVASITQVGVWQELTFDFSDVPSGTFKSMIIYFERNANCDGDVYYFDDIIQVAGSTPTCTPETTENINPASGDINWTFKTSDAAHTFEAFGNTSGAIVNNPVINGINSSCNVQKFTKTAGCETWSGLGTTLATALDFAVITKKAFKMKVLAENQVTQVTLRLERLPFPDTEPSQDRVASITQVGVWQELTFDFSDVTSGTFKSMIIYFERNANCDGDVYYFDDINQVTGSGGGGGGGGSNLAANGDFETGTDSGWIRFQNGGTATLDNTTNNGGTWSGKLTTGGPSNPAFKQERIGAGTVQAGDVIRVRFDHKGSVVQPGAVFNVLLFGEGGSGASFTHVFNPAPTLGASWTTFTGNFTIPPGTDVSQGISFLIEAVCGGDAGCSVSANIDNVSVVRNP
jgi:PKD repeat protein